ncbi:hypothetical protein RSAG8_01607, partial [Rhizoctonia solani AG-8 WAC10335]
MLQPWVVSFKALHFAAAAPWYRNRIKCHMHNNVGYVGSGTRTTFLEQ